MKQSRPKTYLNIILLQLLLFFITFNVVFLNDYIDLINKQSNFTLEKFKKTLHKYNYKYLSQGQSQNQLHKLAELITVKIFSENSQGSGILIEKQNGFYTVLTNEHVLEKTSKHTILTYDGETYEAEKLFDLNQDELGDDLAVLQFQSKQNYIVSRLNSAPLKNDEPVFAAGFPSSTNELLFLDGKISLILDRPLKRGYQVGYFIDIEKGMSGGPLLNQHGEVVGINGKHSYPLFGDKEFYKDGSEVDKPLELLQQSSWAIPINTFVKQSPHILLKHMTLNLPKSKDVARTVSQGELVQDSDIDLTVKFKQESINNINIQLNDSQSIFIEPKSLPINPPGKIKFVSSYNKDLDNDGKPEVIVDLIVENKVKSSYSLIYFYVHEKHDYELIQNFWGLIDDKKTYELKDIETDNILEFKSVDRQFARMFFNPKYSYSPLQIWRYSQGSLNEVTHEYPDLVYDHASRLWRDYKVRFSRNNQEVKGLLAAYLADKHLLCQLDNAWQFIKTQYQESDRQEYFLELENLLKDKPNRSCKL